MIESIFHIDDNYNKSILRFQILILSLPNEFCHLVLQASHMLEKYLNIEDCLEKFLKIKFASKIT